MIVEMSTPQSGIFALGTSSHAYLEFDARNPGVPQELVGAVASLREPRTTMGGVNLVAGFRPELWGSLVPEDTPAGLEGFNRDLVGPDGYTIPATQHELIEKLADLQQLSPEVRFGQLLANLVPQLFAVEDDSVEVEDDPLDHAA